MQGLVVRVCFGVEGFGSMESSGSTALGVGVWGFQGVLLEITGGCGRLGDVPS